MLTGRRCGGTRVEILAVEQHAARVRRLEAGQQPQQRGLAAAGRPEQREEFALLDIERRRSTAVTPPKRLLTFSNRSSGRAVGDRPRAPKFRHARFP